MGVDYISGSRKPMKDWAGWVQVLLPVIFGLTGMYMAVTNNLTTLEINQKNILASQQMIINIVQPLDKKVALLELRVDNLEKGKPLPEK